MLVINLGFKFYIKILNRISTHFSQTFLQKLGDATNYEFANGFV